jgi:hypothetical protein
MRRSEVDFAFRLLFSMKSEEAGLRLKSVVSLFIGYNFRVCKVLASSPKGFVN